MCFNILNYKKFILVFLFMICAFFSKQAFAWDSEDGVNDFIQGKTDKTSYTVENEAILKSSGGSTTMGEASNQNRDLNYTIILNSTGGDDSSMGKLGNSSQLIIGGRSKGEGQTYSDTLSIVSSSSIYSGSSVDVNVKVEDGSTLNYENVRLDRSIQIENNGTINFKKSVFLAQEPSIVNRNNMSFNNSTFTQETSLQNDGNLNIQNTIFSSGLVINSENETKGNVNFVGNNNVIGGNGDFTNQDINIKGNLIIGARLNLHNSSLNLLNGGSLYIGTQSISVGSVNKDDSKFTMSGGTLTLNMTDATTYGNLIFSEQPNITGGTIFLNVDESIVLEDDEQIDKITLLSVNKADADYSFVNNLTLSSSMYSLMFDFENKYFYLINSKKHASAMEKVGGSSEQIKQAEALDNVDRNALSSEGKVMMEELDDLAKKANQDPVQYADKYQKAMSALFDTDGSSETIAPLDETQKEISNSIGDIIESRVDIVLEILEENTDTFPTSQQALNETVIRYGRSAGEIRSKNGISSLWVQGMHSHSKYSKGSAFHMDADGATMGADFRINDNFTAGGSYSYTYSEVNMIGLDSVSKTNSNTFSAYLGYKAGKFMYRLNSSYSLSRVKSNTEITANSRKIYKKDSHNNTVMASVTYKPNAFSYTAGLRYIKIHNATYETNTNMRVDGYNNHTTMGSLGVGYSKFLKLDNAVSLIPSVNVGFNYELNRDNNVLLIHLPANVTMSQKVKNNKRDSYSLGTNLTANVKDVGMFSLGYSGSYKANLKAHTFTLNYRYNF